MKRHSRDWADDKGGIEVLLPPHQEMEVFIRLLLDWYSYHGRKYIWREEDATLYQKILAEILLQRTKSDTVASFFHRFLMQYPSWAELANSQEDDLRQFLYPLGLWKQKAANIKRLAHEIARRGGQFPGDYYEIRDLPGVGQYIANAIALLALNQPRPLLDVNMARVLERYFGPRKLADIRDDPYLQNLARKIIFISNNYIHANFAVLDLAALICKKYPLCNQCPIKKSCKLGGQVK